MEGEPMATWTAVSSTLLVVLIDDQIVVCRLVGSSHALWRHDAELQLPKHFFPRLGISRHVRGIQCVERQTRGLETLVMAGDAILSNDALRCRDIEPRRRLTVRARRKQAGDHR